ncbi:MAG: hypothetical protein ACI9T9_002284, partial [Oleiphilaceae bacterium]
SNKPDLPGSFNNKVLNIHTLGGDNSSLLLQLSSHEATSLQSIALPNFQGLIPLQYSDEYL